MIDWIALASNALWILGCAAGLATLSYASWQASIRGDKFTAQLKRIPIQISLNFAGLLFCAGLAATSGVSLETVLWGILAIAFAAQIVLLEIGRRRAKPDEGG
jgi:membrane protein required for beta-lactamase induction